MAAKSARPPAPDEFISVTRDETFGVSKGFYQKYGIGRWSYVTIYFDADRKRIAFRFTSDRGAGSFTLKKPTTRMFSIIRAHGFFGKYDINVERHARKYKVQRHPSRALGIDEDDDSFVIQLRGRRRSSSHGLPGEASR
jgi:hypothetical protein